MSNGTLHGLVESQVRRTPDALAVIFEQESVSYHELDRRANQLAHHLRRHGVGPEIIVGICLEPSLDTVVAVLGILKSGGAYLPLDPAYPRDRRLFMLRDSKAAAIISRTRFFHDLLHHLGPKTCCIDISHPSIAAESDAPLGTTCIGTNLAYVIYTSGSTGQPKGVMVPHGAVRNYVQWAVRSYGADSRQIAPLHTPLGFDLTVTSLFPPLAAGATVAIIPESCGMETLAQAIHSGPRFCLIKLTPAHLRVLNELLPPSATRGRSDTIVIGGEALTAETLARWRTEAPEVRLINEYGPTETTVGCCAYEVDRTAADVGAIPIGHPIGGADIYVLDADLSPVDPGGTGELYIGGVGVARGYHGRPDFTAERFLPDPFATTPGSRMYRSGDLGRWRPDGVLDFIGRGDDQVKINGYRIELGEIDAVLGRHPVVKNVVTTVCEDHVGEKFLGAYLVCAGEPPTPSELRSFAGERLPHYMVPTGFVFLDAFPLTTNGKIDRQALRALDQRIRPEQAERPRLGAAERSRLFEEPNAPAAEDPKDKCIHELFEAQVERIPDAIAVVHEDQHLTYRELNARSNRLAHYLRSLAVKPDDRVAICIERSLEMVVGVLAVLKAGAAYVPLDPAYPAERLAYMIEDSAPVAMLTDVGSGSALRRHLGSHPVIDLRDEASWAEQSGGNPDRIAVGLTPQHLAYVIYTSGSTGKPKGVMVEHGGLSNLVAAQVQLFAVRADSRVLQFASFSFDASVSEIGMALCSGASLHLGTELLVGDALLRAVGRAGITHLTIPPAVLSALPEGARMEGLRTLIVAGEAPSRAQIKRWSEHCQIINAYGPTEATVCATAWRCRLDDPTETVPIGRPIANARTYILDQYGEPVLVGVAGELCIGGAGVARGYLKRPDLTAERFVADPFAGKAGARMYRTGDFARWLPDGNIEFLGRRDHQLKIRGFRIELGEIEAALLEHEAVAQAIVTAREHIPGDKRLVAYVVGVSQRPLIAALRLHLRRRLPDYMIPSSFVVLDALPLSPNGKIDRRALPAPEARGEAGEYAAPRTAIEEILVQVWAALLGYPQVGIHDNFFDNGGTSIKAAQVVSRIRSPLGVSLRLKDVLEHPTIAQLAKLIDSNCGAQSETAADMIVPRTRETLLPASFAQERIWFVEQLYPSCRAYRSHATIRLRGHLDAGAVKHALDEIVRRHEIFRTTYHDADGQPIQVVHDPYPVDLPGQDFSHLPSVHAERALQQVVADELQRDFDVHALPLIRWRLIRLEQYEYCLVHSEHHLVHDGWSFNVFLAELTQLYEAFVAGRRPSLPRLPIQFADYAIWERDWMTGPEAASDLSYWKSQLANLPTLLPLPCDRPRPPAQTFAGRQLRIELPAVLVAKLGEIARRRGATLFMTLLAGFYALLHRYTGETDIAVGSAVANRDRPELEHLIGMVVNNLVLRADLSGDPTFLQLLDRVRQLALDGYAHQRLPFNAVVSAIQPQRDRRFNPLFQVLFSFHDAPPPPLEAAGLGIELTQALGNGSAKFDWNIIVLRYPEKADQTGEPGLTSLWEYNTDLFDEQTVVRAAKNYEVLLEAIIADPNQHVSELNLIAADERAQLLQGWCSPDTALPPSGTLYNLFELQVERTPNATALVHGEQTVTYAELNRRSNRLAHHLRSLGVQSEVTVGIHLERSAETIVSLLGILKAGGAYVPLDMRYPSERIAYMIADAAIHTIITHQQNAAELPWSGPLVCLDTAWDDGYPDSNPDARGAAASLAYVLYTSGSTGLPKGVAIPHENAVNLLSWAHAYLPPVSTGTWLGSTSLTFDTSVFELFAPLSRGETVSLVENALEWIQGPEDQVALVNTVPSVMAEMLKYRSLPSSIQTVVLAGEPLSIGLLNRLRDVENPPDIINAYGPTEATVFASSARIRTQSTERPPLIGGPVKNTRLYVLDSRLNLVPIGVAGELYIGGAGVARGYVGRPDLTADRFVPDPFATTPGARVYRTGDLVRYRPDGQLEFLGRRDHQVKIRGVRIELGEIEAALAQHPGVRDTAVVVHEEQSGEKSLVGYLICTAGLKPSRAGLQQLLRKKLPEAMVPAEFVFLDALPLTVNGKLDRGALPVPPRTTPTTQQIDAPETAAEKMLAEMWARLLEIPYLSIHDNLFDMGAHSLLATRAVVEIRKAFGVKLPLRQFFATPTVAGLAGFVEQQLQCTV